VTFHSDQTIDHPVIFLVGYRGSGKTTVARLLAGRLGWDWVDADALLEERHACSIKQIFAAEGEAGFRDKEALLLQELCTRRQCVVATGGGIILRAENRELLRTSGLVVWLTAEASTLWQRIQQDSATAHRRPNLAGGGLSEVEELLRNREPLYREVAGLAVATDRRTTEEIADTIVQQLPRTDVK
jgi:shikimate kinase